MREILFRGKRANSGEWVEGAYYHQTEFYGDECDYHYIISSKDELEDNMMCTYLVDPETIGQYTGLTDKNGKRIFEGDIVDMHRKGCGFKPVECVEYEEGGFSPIAVAGWECTPQHNEIEVIGNIHDNPELLNEV